MGGSSLLGLKSLDVNLKKQYLIQIWNEIFYSLQILTFILPIIIFLDMNN